MSGNLMATRLTVYFSPSLPIFHSSSLHNPRNARNSCLIFTSKAGSSSHKRQPTTLSAESSEKSTQYALRTCRNCKSQFDPTLNHPRACRYHTAHFGGETKRKFESVYTGGTMNTPDSGKVLEYWHCCGSEDPFDPGCTAAPHASYDD